MRSSVITNEEAKSHFVENYRFKVLGQEKKGFENSDNESQKELNLSDENQVPTAQISNLTQNEPSYTPVSQDPKIESSFIEELLKRTDELSGNIIKLQMQIENQESEFARRLEAETTRAKEDGLKQGFEEAQVKFDSELKTLEARYLGSISKLESEAAKFEKFVNLNEAELATTAISIAKEVLKKELLADSSKVAHSIANSLMSEIGDAKEIWLKVNPKDFEFLKDSFLSNQNVKITPDEAINLGGVILMSDAGNLDGTIESRLEKIKKIVGE